jgi:branched-chain amino acid transport system substrate-binding protein
MAIKNVAEEGKTILLSCAAAEDIVNPVAKYVFKTPQKDSHAVIRIFQQMKKMGISRIGVLSSNTGFGSAGKKQLEKLAPENGIEIAISEVYDKAATDLTAEVTKLKAANIQALVNWSIEPAQSIVIKNARQLGLNVPIFQSHGFGNINYVKAAGPAAEGVIFPAGRLLVADVLSDRNPQKALLLSYKKAYEAKYKEDVSTFGGHAYDAMIILARGIKEGGADKEKVRTAIENMKGLAGTAGLFNFSPADHNGLDLNAFEMLTVKDGKFAVLEKD